MQPVGILGLGFSGAALAQLLGAEAWSLGHHNGFELANPADWPRIPLDTSCLVYTLPPWGEWKTNRLKLLPWLDWMQEHRPQTRRLVYLSTTGVYPPHAGSYAEGDAYPHHDAAGIRLDTEELFTRFFHCRILRCGGIYGPGRHLGTRLAEGKPLRNLDGPSHRIHVADLAQIAAAAARQEQFPAVLNLVDESPAPQRVVIAWLAAQGWVPLPSLPPETPAPARLVSRERLFNQGLTLQYPNYQAGYAAIYGSK